MSDGAQVGTPEREAPRRRLCVSIAVQQQFSEESAQAELLIFDQLIDKI